MKQFFQQLKTWQIFFIYLSTLLIINYVTNGIIFGSVEDKEFIVKNFLIYNFAFQTILNIIKIGFICLIILAGSLIVGLKLKSRYILKSIILSSFIFFIRPMVLFTWATINWSRYSLDELKSFNQKTFVSFKIGDSESLLNRLTGQFNIYDIVFIASLIFFIKMLSHIQWKESSRIVASSYLPSLAIYALFIVYLGSI